MLALIRSTDGQVTVVDAEIGTVTAPSEFEAWREVERRKAARDQNGHPQQSPALVEMPA